MRIIAGSLGGRLFDSPHGHRTHPMSDKIRGALFNALGDVQGLTVLDAFAGSGALSFEAVSRGAASVTAIDNDRSAQQVIAENIQSLGLERQVKLVKADTARWLHTTSAEQFNIVLADPPYDDLQADLLAALAELVRPDGLVIYSLPPSAEVALSDSYQLVTAKDYGDAQLAFYRRIQ